MTFKQSHEKANTRYLIPPKAIQRWWSLDALISSFLLLRIYLRDKNSAILEQSLYKLLGHQAPAPIIYYVGSIEEYCFSICRFIQGITLRDLLLSDAPHNRI